MSARVLVVTGGLLSGDEESSVRALRKWLAQWSASEAACLDLQVKLLVAEPLVAAALERLRSPLSRDPVSRIGRRRSDPATAETIPSLTEVTLATLLAREGIDYETLTVDDVFRSPRRTERMLSATDCVLLSTTYLHDLSELEPIVKRLDRPHNRLVVGALAGVLDGRWEGLPQIDVVAVGYGEYLVPALADWMRAGRGPLQAPPTGRVVRRRHSVFVYSGVPTTRDLDSLPRPDWGLVRADEGGAGRTIQYESVRGCPYRCNFCNYPFLFDDTAFRYKSARRMADDWEHYVDTLGVEAIVCLDSLFTVPRARLREFCRLLIERHIRVRWVCYARADDLADEGIVELMTRAGASQVHIGIESGEPGQLERMNKVCTVESNAAALGNCRKHGLTSIVSLIVGFPGETASTVDRTFGFLQATPPDFYFLAPFSTRVVGVPLLRPENRRRFALQVSDNTHAMAPYWRHATMCCSEVGRFVRRLDQRIMRERVALNAALFYPGLPRYAPAERQRLLDWQLRVADRHPWVVRLFDGLHGWVERRLAADVADHLGSEPGSAPVGEARPVAHHGRAR